MTAPEPAAAEASPAPDSGTWQRLSPAAIIHFIVKFIIGFGKNGIQNVAYLGGIAIFTGDNRWLILGALAGVATIALVTGGLLSYLNFRFRLDGHTFLIRRGVIRKKRLTLSFDRIQNVAIKEPIYFKPFGLVSLALESAGSSSEEVSLAGIPRAQAADIRNTVLRQAKAATPLPSEGTDAPAPGSAAAPENEPILVQPVSELARYGLTNNNVWVVAGVAVGAVFQQYDQWEGTAEAFIADTIIPVIGADTAALTVFFLGVAVALIALLMSFSVLGAIIVHYGYRLSLDEGRYHRVKGLFERQETSVPESKIQSLQIRQPWPALFLKRHNLILKQVGFKAAADTTAGSKGDFIIPSVTETFLAPFVRTLFGGLDWAQVACRGIHPAYIRKTLLYWFLLPATVPALLLTYHLGAVGLLPLALPVLMLPFVFLRDRRYGYWSDGATAVVRHGLVGTQQTVFSFHKVQTVTLTQSPGQRTRNLATLKVKLAGQTVVIPYMPLVDAVAWRDRILYRVETSRQPWM